MSVNLETNGFAEVYAKVGKRWLSPDDLAKEYGFSKSTQAKMRMASDSSTKYLLVKSMVNIFAMIELLLINGLRYIKYKVGQNELGSHT